MDDLDDRNLIDGHSLLGKIVAATIAVLAGGGYGYSVWVFLNGISP